MSHLRTLGTALLILASTATPLFADSMTITRASSETGCAAWDVRPECLQIEGLPNDAPSEPVIITVDTARNTVYLFRNGELVKKAPAATGMDTRLKSGSREWLFRTPRGRMRVQGKIVNPVWYKPDWAFIEEGKKIPPRDSPKRYVKGKLGKFALDLGDGILVHGTDDPKSIGKKASHGCIRLSDRMMEQVFKAASVGTLVYVY